MTTHTQYLTGASNNYVRAAAEAELYGKLGLMIQPGTTHYGHHIESFSSWAMDNGCFSKAGEFDGDQFLRELERIIQTCSDAHEKCLFAVAPDVFDPVARKGDPIATLERSRPWFDRIREAGAPVAFVAQDGIEDLADAIPWEEFDVLFIGGSDEFKLGYPSGLSNGAPRYMVSPSGEVIDQRSRRFFEMLNTANQLGKGIHLGRANSMIRLAFAWEVGAESADGTFLAMAGAKAGIDRVKKWFAGDKFNLIDELKLELEARPVLPIAA